MTDSSEAFKTWLKGKTLRDKAVEYIDRLESERAIKFESLLEVAICLCAVNRLIRDSNIKKRDYKTDNYSTNSIITESRNNDYQPETNSNNIKELNFSVGSKVEANYKSQNRWYPCSIIRTTPDGCYDVEYFDGVRESGIQPLFIRPIISVLEEKNTEIIGDPVIMRNGTEEEVKLITFAEGEKVEANYRRSGEWQKGVITRIRFDGQFDVEYDDGMKENRVEKSHIRHPSVDNSTRNNDYQPETNSNNITELKFSVGSNVEANYKGQHRWNPCKIMKITADGFYDVEYIDGIRESGIQPQFIRPVIPLVEEKYTEIIGDTVIMRNGTEEDEVITFAEGEKVEANYRGSGEWQRGIIRKVRFDGRFDIDYIDGLRELRVEKSDIRHPTVVNTISESGPDMIGASATQSDEVATGNHATNGNEIITLPTKFSSTELLVVGSKIEGNFKSIGRWYPGCIVAVFPDETFDIDYDDGDKEQRVSRIMIRTLENPASRSRSSSPSGRTKTWNSFFNMPPSRNLSIGSFHARKGCTCAIPGYDCHRKGGCLFESLQLSPLDVANRPRFTVRKFCDCEGLCGCKGNKVVHELKEEKPVEEEAPPSIVMVSFAVQTDEPVDTVDEGMQYDGPLMVENGIQYEGFTEQKSMQTENFTDTKFMQTENPQSEYAIQSDGPVFVDQACQTINFEKRRKKEIHVPFDKRGPFVVRALCLDGCVCCCSRPAGRNKTVFQPKSTEISLKNIWTKWAMEHHTFSNVVLTEKEINQFSGAVREFLVAPSEVVSFSTSTTVFHPSVQNMMQNRLSDELTDAKNTLPSLKYFMTDKKSERSKSSQNGLIVKELTNDQRLQNKLFLRECRNLWKIAEFILNTRIIQYVISGSKEKFELVGIVNDLIYQLQKNETKALYEFSLKKLRVMLEDDEDKRQRDESERTRQRLREGASSHQQFVKKKDSLRVWMPSDLAIKTSRPVFSFSGNESGFASGSSVGSSTVGKIDIGPTSAEILSGLNYKYIHATNGGKSDSDLEKSKSQIRKLLSFRRQREQQAEQLRHMNELAYDEWLTVREMKEKATKLLGLLRAPKFKILEPDYSKYAPSSATDPISIISMENFRKCAPASIGDLKYCIMVGECLKKIDRSLVSEWTEWSSDFISGAVAAALWDFFSPRACDIHSMYFSKARDVFLKLLRPGVDYQEIIMHFAEKNLFAERIDKYLRENHPPETTGGDERNKFETRLKTVKLRWMDDICIGVSVLKNLISAFGVSLTELELEDLVISFDSNAMEQIPLYEFYAFVGPYREKKVGISMHMKQRCCFATTCTVTGMSNAYSSFTPSRRFLREHATKIQSLVPGKNNELDTLSGKMKLQMLPSGRKRGQIELVERKNREALLKYLNLMKVKEISVFVNDNLPAAPIPAEEQIKVIQAPTAPTTMESQDMDAITQGSGPEKQMQNSSSAKLALNYENDFEEPGDQKNEATHHQGGEEQIYAKKTDGGEVVTNYENDFEEPPELNTYTDDFEINPEQVLVPISEAPAIESIPTNKIDDSTVIGPVSSSILDELISESSDLFRTIATEAFEDQASFRRYLVEYFTSSVLKDVVIDFARIIAETLHACYRPCEFSLLDLDSRKASLIMLSDLTRAIEEEQKLKLLFTSGKPPAPPKLWLGPIKPSDKKGKKDPILSHENDVQLQLYWEPGDSKDHVSFYSLEFGGRVGVTLDIRYEELFRDPDDASPEKKSVYTFGIGSLVPGASYYFRLRALNGHGSSEYTYKIFTTLTVAPMHPLATKISSHSITLTWLFTKKFVNRFLAIKSLFDAAKNEKNGKVLSNDLAEMFERFVSKSSDLQVFLDRYCRELGVDTATAKHYHALFDRIEPDEDGTITWAQLETFFFGNDSRWNHAMSGKDPENGKNPTLRAFFGRSSYKVKAGEVTYVLEKCVSEAEDRYVEVVRTTNGHATLTRLAPGESYRFRLYSLNVNGVGGPRSQPIIIHTLLETPFTPTCAKESIGSTHCIIQWRKRAHSNTRATDTFATERLLDTWAGLQGERDSGVNIALAFKQFDKAGQGMIDIAQFTQLLRMLNVEPNEERLQQAMTIFSPGLESGLLSFRQFHFWWYRSDCSYLLRRSHDHKSILEIAKMKYESPNITVPPPIALENALPEQQQQLQQSLQFTAGMKTYSKTSSSSSFASKSPEAAIRSMRMSKASLHSTVSSLSSGASNISAMFLPGQVQAMSTIPEEKSLLDASIHKASAGYNPRSSRPKSASGSSVRSSMSKNSQNNNYTNDNNNNQHGLSGGSDTTLSIARESGSWVAATVPITSYSGDDTQMEVHNLIPNRTYQFRVRFIGSRSNSAFSDPVTVLTKPLPPSPGIVLDVSPTGVRVKWYPPQYGAMKFLVELMQVNSTPEPWVAAYYGQENSWTSTILNANSQYKLRVLAINEQDMRSEPSEEITFRTLTRDQPHDFFKDTLKQKNALESFVIDCNGDICVGDIILLTERLYLRMSDSALVSCNPAESKGVLSEQIAYQATSGADKYRSDIPSEDNNSAGNNPESTFLGERTIAAMVLRDNYRVLRDKLSSRGDRRNSTVSKSMTTTVDNLDIRKFTAQRRLWLEVIWQQASTDACKPFELKAGDIIERRVAHLEQFEVLRCRWREEAKRLPLAAELKLLSECFHQTPLSDDKYA